MQSERTSRGAMRRDRRLSNRATLGRHSSCSVTATRQSALRRAHVAGYSDRSRRGASWEFTDGWREQS